MVEARSLLRRSDVSLLPTRSSIASAAVVSLPAVIPAAPWQSTIEALLWAHAATPAARAALPPRLAPRAGLPLTIAGLIAYLDGPVGPYDEIFGAPVMLRDAALLSHVAFMAVNSQASIAGGRRNWALPKVLASFDGEVARPGHVVARGDDWEVHVTATARPRRVPFAAAFRCTQVWSDGVMREFTVRMRGRARLTRVQVRHGAPSALSEWLVEGRHLGLMLTGMQEVSAVRA
jgi:Acetoacetate decarboxylase (ADC)